MANAASQRCRAGEGVYNILGRALFAPDRSEEAAAFVARALETKSDGYNTYIPYLNVLGRLRSSCVADAQEPRCGGARLPLWATAHASRSRGTDRIPEARSAGRLNGVRNYIVPI